MLCLHFYFQPSPKFQHIVLIKGAWCTIAREIFPYAFEISSCVFFVIPMTIITVLYVLIGLKLRRPRGGSGSNSQELNVEPRSISNRHSQSHVIRMLGKSRLYYFSIILFFITCKMESPFGSMHLFYARCFYCTGKY